MAAGEHQTTEGSWQPDPTGRYKLRWLNTSDIWTDHVYSADGTPATDPFLHSGTAAPAFGHDRYGRTSFEADRPPPTPEPRVQASVETPRVVISRAVTWLLGMVAIGTLASAGLLALQLYRGVQTDDAARARVEWLTHEHDSSVQRWNASFARADDLRQRCVRGEDVGFEWVTELGIALAHAERALAAGQSAVEGAHATGQTELADRLSQAVSDNRESWAAEMTRHSLLVSSPLALNCN